MGAPISRELSIRERAYHLIQQKIVSGELTSGTAISELSLAKELNSSRTPVREAIGQLVSEGVLEQIPNRGTIVAQFTRHDILELYELREALEVYAVEKVAQQKIDSSDQERLYGLVDEIHVLHEELVTAHGSRLNQEQMQRFVRADLAYHTLLLRLAANRRILKVVQDTRLLMRIFSMRREGHDPGLLVQIHRFHREILDAVVAGNGEAAKRLLREHIQLSRQERLQSFDHWERESSLSQSLPVFMSLPISDQ
jgi:DNA-binding GntR family transcriptional regulator